MRQKNPNTWALRTVFAGDPSQHLNILQASRSFLTGSEPGVLVIGGTCLTGKSTLKGKMLDYSHLVKWYPTSKDEKSESIDPKKSYFDSTFCFSDMEGLPKGNFQPLIHDKGLQEALKQGVRIVVLNEIWAGQRDGFKIIRDELVHKHKCKVIIDAVSLGEGRGFYDWETNNRFIETQVRSVFSPKEAHVHTLQFKPQVVAEALLDISANWPDNLEGQVRFYFGIEANTILALFQRHIGNEGAIQRGIEEIMGIGNLSHKEKKG